MRLLLDTPNRTVSAILLVELSKITWFFPALVRTFPEYPIQRKIHLTKTTNDEIYKNRFFDKKKGRIFVQTVVKIKPFDLFLPTSVKADEISWSKGVFKLLTGGRFISNVAIPVLSSTDRLTKPSRGADDEMHRAEIVWKHFFTANILSKFLYGKRKKTNQIKIFAWMMHFDSRNFKVEQVFWGQWENEPECQTINYKKSFNVFDSDISEGVR